jgi:hypothetical protein
MMRPIYMSEVSLTTSYNRPYSDKVWITASFNDSGGDRIAWYSFTLRSNNQTLGPIWITSSFGPGQPGAFSPVSIDSLRMTFSSDQYGYFVDVGARASGDTGALSPVELTRGDQATETISYDNLGLSGKGSNQSDFWLWLSGMSYQSGNHTVTMTVDLTAHNFQSSLTGSSYSAEAVFSLIVEPHGLVYVSNQ